MQIITKLASYLLPIPIEQQQGLISPYLEVSYDSGKYVLSTRKVNYSFGGLHVVFKKAFKKFQIEKREIKNVLILGFGAGSVSSLLINEYGKDCMIIGIEKDPTVIELANKYFNLEQYKELELICEDAYDYVQHCNGSFDMVVVDIFVDKIVPQTFQEAPFINHLKGLLNNDGILFFNKISDTQVLRVETEALRKLMSDILGFTIPCKMKVYGVENTMLVYDRSSENNIN